MCLERQFLAVLCLRGTDIFYAIYSVALGAPVHRVHQREGKGLISSGSYHVHRIFIRKTKVGTAAAYPPLPARRDIVHTQVGKIKECAD